MKNLIVSKLKERTTEQLIEDAKTAGKNMTEESNRMVCALAMDVIAERISEVEWEKLYTEIYGE